MAKITQEEFDRLVLLFAPIAAISYALTRGFVEGIAASDRGLDFACRMLGVRVVQGAIGDEEALENTARSSRG